MAAYQGKVQIYNTTHFPRVAQGTEAIETIKRQALAEYRTHDAEDQAMFAALSRLLDLAFEAGKRTNEMVPLTALYVNVKELERKRKVLEERLLLLTGLCEETPGFFERLGFGGSTALRNAIKENACRPLADALLSDLCAILAGYRVEDRYTAPHLKIEGIDRLLLILDDYEKVQAAVGEFLVSYLLPALKTAPFESVVVILGRDQFAATHPAWDQHLRPTQLKSMTLDPLPWRDMDALVESYGLHSAEGKERAWRDTHGYPFYVQLWCRGDGVRGAQRRDAEAILRSYDAVDERARKALAACGALFGRRSYRSALPHEGSPSDPVGTTMGTASTSLQ
jgi:hypothetical protein